MPPFTGVAENTTVEPAQKAPDGLATIVTEGVKEELTVTVSV